MANSPFVGRATTNPVRNSLVSVRADVTRYVNKIGNDGWLKTREGAANPAKFVYLCKYTKVTLVGSKSGRTFFVVADGPNAGKTLNMADANAKEYLGKTAPTASGIDVLVEYGKYVPDWVSVARRGQRLEQQMASVTADGLRLQATMNTVWGTGFYPIPSGTYALLIPDYPHGADMTRFYRDSEPSLLHDQVWFPIDYGDRSRYLHVGNVSDGCTTILSLGKWADLQEKVVSHRTAEGKHVGQLIVSGTPERAR